jgi:hypothetical protein
VNGPDRDRCPILQKLIRLIAMRIEHEQPYQVIGQSDRRPPAARYL